MTKETLVLFTSNQQQYRITLCNYDTVIESEKPELMGKSVTYVWRWARMHMARVYNGDFLPPKMARTA